MNDLPLTGAATLQRTVQEKRFPEEYLPSEATNISAKVAAIFRVSAMTPARETVLLSFFLKTGDQFSEIAGAMSIVELVFQDIFPGIPHRTTGAGQCEQIRTLCQPGQRP